MTIPHLFRKILFPFILLLITISATAQTVTLCQAEEFDIYEYFETELDDCSPTATLEITSATAGGVATGVPPSSIVVLSDGFISVNILNGATVCASASVQVDVIEANFTATAVQGSCHIVNIEGPQNEPGCNYTYNIGGNTYPGPDLPNFAFANGGLQTIRLDVSCGGCLASQNITIDVDGPIAGLDFASSEVIYYDDNFESLVVCTDLAASDLTITDISQQLTGIGTTGSLQILAPDNSIFNQNPYPDPITISLDQEGQYVFTYTLIDDGCMSTVSYDIFVSNPNVSTDLEVPVTVTPFTCEDTSYDVNVCPNGCPTNPSGTVYTVELDCTGFVYQTTEVPFTISVPLSVASCGETCTSGGTTTYCACELIVRAARPCVNEISNAICPFQIQPQPNAEFEILPNTANNTYCIGGQLTFQPEWDNIDCNGPNPTPSICEIQNPQWTVTPATGFVNISGNLQTYPLDLQFTTPGNYTICFEWENACGSDSYCQTICILDDTPPTVNWNNVPIICVGDAVIPDIAVNSAACSNAEIEWSSASEEVSFSDSSASNPSITFSSSGNYTVDIDVSGLCEPFTESANYTVCDAPEITISNSNPTLCVGQEFCFDALASTSWNNCPGDVIWTIPGVAGSPFTNPTPAQLCLAFNTAQSFDITVAATNICGTATETISITIDESPSCPIAEPGDFCPGETVQINPPLGAVNPVWYASADGINFTVLAGGMPHTPSGTTYYYVESQINGCFCISDTVVANFFAEPNFSLNATNTNPCLGEEVVFQLSNPQGDVNWYNGSTLIATQSELSLSITESVTITAEVIYGSAAVPCSVSESITINPIENPVTIDCTSIPTVWCAGDAPSDLPDVLPGGGLAYITDGVNTLITDPVNIDPGALGTGDFYFVYEVINWGSSNCTYSDSCAFSIVNPQIPIINPQPDTLCYYSAVQFTESAGLNGSWTSSCPGAISSTGFFDPQSAGCPSGNVVELYYSGECVQNDTISVYLIPTPSVSVQVSNTNPCPGDVVDFSVSPPQPNINWLDEDGNIIGTDAVLSLEITQGTTVTAQVVYGVQNTSCEVLSSFTISPEVNPISINCSAIPTTICAGNAPIAMPSISPAGGTVYITDGSEIVQVSPEIIDPDILETGDYYLVYELTNWGAGACDFRDSCNFSIIEPQVPNITPLTDSLCFNETLQLTENSGLTGAWSSSCTGAIDQNGLFSPQSAGCTPGSTFSIYYSGECISNDTIEIFVIPIPSTTITIPVTDICTNDCLDLEAAITGDYDEAIWNLSWTGGTVSIPFGGSFCPEDHGITTSLQVTVELSVSVNQNPICRVSETITLNTIGIPDDDFLIDSPQCIAAGVTLPECENCDDYSIIFENLSGSTFDCAVPGDGCALPDTGMYSYEMTYNFGFCSSDVFTGALHIIDAPFLEITHLHYDSCAPVAFYELTYGGFDHSVLWETDGDLTNIGNIGNDLYTATINHISDIQVDAIYTDQITVSNACGSLSDSRTVYHKALPDFTLDPDSTFYCDGQYVPLDIGFAQPLDVDSIVVTYFYENNEELVLSAIPQELIYFNFDSEFDTLEVNFTVTAYNPCGAITKTLTAFVLPTDVSADMDIPLTTPVCVGDTIPISINSSGNTSDDTRQITTSNPYLEVFHTLGKWYLIPQEGITDGAYDITLTELGLCGADMDTENFTFGPSITADFQANNACLGNPVNFTPLLSQEADLTWTFAPDTSRNTDFPPPYFYQRPGVYFPTLFAEAEGYCSDLTTREIEIFEPRIPILTCAPDCGGKQGCMVNANNSSICVTVAEPDKFISYEWRVHGRFSPYYGQTLRIDVDSELEPCGNNLVTLYAKDLRGCESKVSKKIDFNDDLIYIPNSFTPNEDGFNDLFKPVIDSRISSDLYELTIYNRWGELVFQTSDPDEAWNGNDLSSPNHYSEAAVYTYMMKYKSCRNPNESDPQVLRGIVTLIR